MDSTVFSSRRVASVSGAGMTGVADGAEADDEGRARSGGCHLIVSVVAGCCVSLAIDHDCVAVGLLGP